ncbi:MAG: hypothetical protein ACJAW3_001623 [Lentimonas sp.]|jgi:hypothetical protein
MNNIEIITGKPKESTEHKAGNIYKLHLGDIYILSRVGEDLFNLISLQTGNRFTTSGRIYDIMEGGGFICITDPIEITPQIS